MSTNIKLLLTGFQGWGSIRINPSEVIGKRLDGTILQLSAQPEQSVVPEESLDNPKSSKQATVTFQSLRVSYRDVEKLVPAMHESGEWDCIVHLGVAAGYKTCTIETGSNTTGYILQDVDGEMAPELKDSRGIDCKQPRWESTLDCQRCCEDLNGLGFEHVKLSADPGNFLCGYTTACSLKCAYTYVEQASERKPIPVVFFHVPLLKEDDPTAPYTLNELTDIVRELCSFIAREALKNSSRRDRNSEFEHRQVE